MIDWHTHILPNMDDGSSSASESKRLLFDLADQGVDHVIATPHYIHSRESVNDFLARRAGSFDRLMAEIGSSPISLSLGAEVAYYHGIGKSNDIDRLCIEHTNLLLLEMPYAIWTESMLRDVIELSACRDIRVVLAHVDRYLKYSTPEQWTLLKRGGCLFQWNANFHSRFLEKCTLRKRMKQGYIDCLGSDCHNMTARPPRIRDGWRAVERMIGKNETQNLLLHNDEIYMDMKK